MILIYNKLTMLSHYVHNMTYKFFWICIKYFNFMCYNKFIFYQDVYSGYFCGEGVPDFYVNTNKSFPKPFNYNIRKDPDGKPLIEVKNIFLIVINCNKIYIWYFRIAEKTRFLLIILAMTPLNFLKILF